MSSHSSIANSSLQQVVEQEENNDSPIAIVYEDIFGHEEESQTDNTGANPSVTTNIEKPTPETLEINSNTKIQQQRQIIPTVSTAQQRYCCVLDCNNVRGKKLRHNLKFYTDSDFKPDYLQKRWEKICSECFKHRDTPRNTTPSLVTATKSSFPKMTISKTPNPKPFLSLQKQKSVPKHTIEEEVESEAEKSENEDVKERPTKRAKKLTTDKNYQTDCCVVGCANPTGRHDRFELQTNPSSPIIFKKNFIQKNYNLICNSCYMKYFVAGITNRRKAKT